MKNFAMKRPLVCQARRLSFVRNRSLLTLLICAALWLPSVGFGQDAAKEMPARSPIVAKSIAFHGGELFRATDTRLRMCSKSGCSTLSARIDGDDFTLQAETQSKGKKTRVLSTNQAVQVWRDEVLQTVAAEEEQRWRDWVMQRVYFVFLPYRLEDPSVRHEDLGLVAWGERSLHKVKVTFEAGTSTDASDQYMYWFDPETGLMVQFAYSYAGEPGGLRFRHLYNFRRVGGLAFFDQDNFGAEGEGLSVDQIDENFVKEKMKRVSRIDLSELSVSPID